MVKLKAAANAKSAADLGKWHDLANWRFEGERRRKKQNNCGYKMYFLFLQGKTRADNSKPDDVYISVG